MVDEATPASAPADAAPEAVADQAVADQAVPDAAPAEVVTDAAPEAPAPAPAPPEPERLSLRDFCIRHSKVVREVELLGAFFHEERARANHFDTATAYRERFEALRVRPA